MTVYPASTSRAATVPPPAPEPTTTKSAEVEGASPAWTAGCGADRGRSADVVSGGADPARSPVRGIRKAGRATAALSRSRRFTLGASGDASEGLQKPNQCTLVVVA